MLRLTWIVDARPQQSWQCIIFCDPWSMWRSYGSWVTKYDTLTHHSTVDPDPCTAAMRRRAEILPRRRRNFCGWAEFVKLVSQSNTFSAQFQHKQTLKQLPQKIKIMWKSMIAAAVATSCSLPFLAGSMTSWVFTQKWSKIKKALT